MQYNELMILVKSKSLENSSNVEYKQFQTQTMIELATNYTISYSKANKSEFALRIMRNYNMTKMQTREKSIKQCKEMRDYLP